MLEPLHLVSVLACWKKLCSCSWQDFGFLLHISCKLQQRLYFMPPNRHILLYKANSNFVGFKAPRCIFCLVTIQICCVLAWSLTGWACNFIALILTCVLWSWTSGHYQNILTLRHWQCLLNSCNRQSCRVSPRLGKIAWMLLLSHSIVPWFFLWCDIQASLYFEAEYMPIPMNLLLDKNIVMPYCTSHRNSS